MATRLEIAEKKLERLEKEIGEQTERVFSHQRLTNGQPMNDKRGGAAFFKRQKQLEDKAINLSQEIEAQRERVERLRWKENFAKEGLTPSGGLKKNVENLERWQERVERQEFIRDYNKANKLPVGTPFENEQGHLEFYNSVRLKEAKETVKMLMELKEKSEQAESKMSGLTQELIESGAVNQWAKKPIYYFVKGLRKVALEIDENGEFKVSKRYPATTDAEHEFLEDLGVKL